MSSLPSLPPPPIVLIAAKTTPTPAPAPADVTEPRVQVLMDVLRTDEILPCVRPTPCLHRRHSRWLLSESFLASALCANARCRPAALQTEDALQNVRREVGGVSVLVRDGADGA